MQQLRRLTLPADLERVAALPDPEESLFKEAAAEQVFQVATSFLHMWIELLCMPSPPSGPGVSHTCHECGRRVRLDGWSLWNRALFVVGAYYDLALCQLWGAEPRPAPHAEKLISQISDASKPVQERDRSSRKEHGDITTGCSLLAYYGAALSSIGLDSSLGAFVSRLPFDPALHAAMELVVYAALSYLGSTARFDIPRGQLALCSRLMGTIAKLQRRSVGSEKKLVMAHKVGPFSAIRLAELPALARQDAAEITKYGQKHVAAVFEQQLALIMQSLGLFVVQTRTGERSVDLVCLSGDPSNAFPFLLEAKTGKRPYALPTDDERALVEYIGEVRRSVPTIGPLSFVLVVGPSPARTLGRKLERVQSRAAVPVRFCAAEEIAHLRELTPSLFPMSIFQKHMLDSPTILPTGFARELADKYEHAQALHRDLVKGMLGLEPRRSMKP